MKTIFIRMVITYYGLSCFKVQSGDSVMALDPFGKGETFPAPRFEAHIIAYTDQSIKRDFSIAGSPLLFDTPGEYETRDISLVGFDTPEGVPFFIEWEGMRLFHAGPHVSLESIDQLLDSLGRIDILFIGSGGKPSETQKIIAQIDPRIVIPMQGRSTKNSPDELAHELGEKPERLDKLTIKLKGLPQEGQRVVILSAERS